MQSTKNPSLVFYIMWASVGLISLFDLYLAIEHQDTILEQEENPLAKAIILCCGMATFTVVKIVGTLICMLVVRKAYEKSKKLGWALCAPIFLLQVWLLWYLLFAGPE